MNYFANQYIKLFLKILFTIGMLTIVFKSVPLNQVMSTILESHLSWLALGTLFFILSKYFSSVRLNLFFKNGNSEINSIYNQKLYLLGMFYNFFLPTGVGGDVYKVIKIHNDYLYSLKRVTSIVLLDRVSGLVALINLVVLFSLYFINRTHGITLCLVILLGNVLYPLIVRKFISNHLISFKTEFLSWLVQMSQCICAYCILKAIDISNNELLYIIVFLISSIASLFPLSIGGLGAREYTFMVAATYFHLDIEKAIAIGFLFYIISLFVSLWGSYFIFKHITPEKTHANL